MEMSVHKVSIVLKEKLAVLMRFSVDKALTHLLQDLLNLPTVFFAPKVNSVIQEHLLQQEIVEKDIIVHQDHSKSSQVGKYTKWEMMKLVVVHQGTIAQKVLLNRFLALLAHTSLLILQIHVFLVHKAFTVMNMRWRKEI